MPPTVHPVSMCRKMCIRDSLQLDWTVGEIMHTLDSLGIADNTIFVFCSDNGPVIDDGYHP